MVIYNILGISRQVTTPVMRRLQFITFSLNYRTPEEVFNEELDNIYRASAR